MEFSISSDYSSDFFLYSLCFSSSLKGMEIFIFDISFCIPKGEVVLSFSFGIYFLCSGTFFTMSSFCFSLFFWLVKVDLKESILYLQLHLCFSDSISFGDHSQHSDILFDIVLSPTQNYYTPLPKKTCYSLLIWGRSQNPHHQNGVCHCP